MLLSAGVYISLKHSLKLIELLRCSGDRIGSALDLGRNDDSPLVLLYFPLVMELVSGLSRYSVKEAVAPWNSLRLLIFFNIFLIRKSN